MHEKQDWLTSAELAAYLSVSRDTIRRWVREEKIPHARVGRVVRFSRPVVDQFMANQRRELSS